MNQATPKLSEDKVRQCVDGRLGGDYPPKAVAKVIRIMLKQFSISFLNWQSLSILWSSGLCSSDAFRIHSKTSCRS